MGNRRQFIETGLALSALCSTGVAAPRAAWAQEPGAPPIDGFVVDQRFPEAVDIARRMARTGIALWPISGDLTDLWYNTLYFRWKAAPAAFGELTTAHSLFVLETLAADHRMRVVYRARRGLAGGRVARRPSGPFQPIDQADARADLRLFPTPLAGTVAMGPALPRRAPRDLATTANELSDEDAVFFWIIAPRARSTASV